MLKKILLLSLASLFTVSLFACGGGTKPDKEEKDTAGESSNSKHLSIYDANDTWTDEIIQSFQEKTGIQVDRVSGGAGELTSRIKAEAGNPIADIMMGGANDTYEAMAESWEAYTSPQEEHIDQKYIDPNHKWHSVSVDPFVIIYNTELVSEEAAPKSWDDLLKPEFKGKIAYADPNKSGSSFTLLATMITAAGKDDGKGYEFIKEFVANLDGKIIGSSSALYKGVADGEYAVGLTFEEGALKYVVADAPMKIVYPEPGTTILMNSCAIVKDAPNMENAKLFIDHIQSKEVQDILKKFNRRSVRGDVEESADVIPVSDIKAIDYDLNWVSENKVEMLDFWKETVTG